MIFDEWYRIHLDEARRCYCRSQVSFVTRSKIDEIKSTCLNVPAGCTRLEVLEHSTIVRGRTRWWRENPYRTFRDTESIASLRTKGHEYLTVARPSMRRWLRALSHAPFPPKTSRFKIKETEQAWGRNMWSRSSRLPQTLREVSRPFPPIAKTAEKYPEYRLV